MTPRDASDPITQTIRIKNPNSNTALTQAMLDALGSLCRGERSEIDCFTLANRPFGIESEADTFRVAPLLAYYIKADNEANASVIACYSDPGLNFAKG